MPNTHRTARRWHIIGKFETTSPLHVGDGTVTERSSLKNGDTPVDVQAVVKDYEGKPCIPGTAIKGVLRAWAEAFFPNDRAIDRLFGPRALTDSSESGWAEFGNAKLTTVLPDRMSQFGKYVPYWQANTVTGVASHVCLDRRTGTARAGMLYYEEFAPRGLSFEVEIGVSRLDDEDIGVLLAVLEQGHSHATHPYHFGANGADGWGRVKWHTESVKRCDPASGYHPTGIGFTNCKTTIAPARGQIADAPRDLVLKLKLSFRGPFLVNDADHARRPEWTVEQNQGRTNFTPVRNANGEVSLPSSSFRGALRQRAEFLARSLGEPAPAYCGDLLETGSIGAIFGHTGRAARLKIGEFLPIGTSHADRHQDFVTIDRFTGGAADGAKFDAKYADRPAFTTDLVLSRQGLCEKDIALLAIALADVCAGKVPIGFGGAKGYGEASGILTAVEVPPDFWGLTKEIIENPPALAAWASQRLERPIIAPTDLTASNEPASGEALTEDFLIVQSSNPGFFNYFLNSQQTMKKPVRADYKEISQDLVGKVESEIAVEYAIENGKPVRIRIKGQPFIPAPAAPLADLAPQPVVNPRSGVFANPYYFLRMEERKFSPKLSDKLGDKAPAGHDRYHPDLISGKLSIRLTTKTPLLLCDSAHATSAANGHKTYPVLLDADKKPLLASPSVRGMLRAAYEAVTNSRFAVFAGHDDRLGLRMNAQDGLGLVPCQVNGKSLRLLNGTTAISGNTLNGPQYAAWLPMKLLTPPLGVSFNHRDRVTCWIEEWERTPWDRYDNIWLQDRKFRYWKVLSIGPFGTTLSVPVQNLPIPRPEHPTGGNSHHTSLGNTPRPISDGFVCRTEHNFNRKYNERVFFSDSTIPGIAELPIYLSDEEFARLSKSWSTLIANYRTNQDLVNGKPRPGALNAPAVWSRHMADPADENLGDGALVYAKLAGSKNHRQVTTLYPVMISRKLYELAPVDLLPESLRPAAREDQLSPADRVFGWVAQQPDEHAGANESPAYRGQVRIGPVECTTPDAVHYFTEPKPLAILGQPKPAQGRFYLGDKNGNAQQEGRTKEEAGYTGKVGNAENNRIRGPKVYPHHQAGIENQTAYATSLPPADQRTSQNRSIEGFVKPEMQFTFDLHFVNLTRFELGGLLWLLNLQANHYLRLGLGKPLGFGSVRAEVIESTMANGRDWVTALTSGLATNNTVDSASLINDFETTMNAANPNLLKSFCKTAAGFPDLKIHYPQLPRKPHYEHYHWFTANEKVGGMYPGRRMTLPDLLDHPELPNNPG